MAEWEVASAIGSLLGGIGGLAGLVALVRQQREMNTRKRIAHLPPELRAVLIDAVDVLGGVANSPRDRAWIREHVEPVHARLKPLLAVVGTASDIAKGGDLTLVDLALHGVAVLSFDDTRPKDSGRLALAAVEQRKMAEQGREAAAKLLRALHV